MELVPLFAARNLNVFLAILLVALSIAATLYVATRTRAG